MYRFLNYNINSKLMLLVILLSDILALIIIGVTSVLIRHSLHGKFYLTLYWKMWPIIILFIIIYAFAGLYPGFFLNSPEEFKKLTQASSLCFLILGAIVFIFRKSFIYSRGIFFMSWVLVILGLPLSRTIVRKICIKWKWWGIPTVIVGNHEGVKSLLNLFIKKPERGFKPVAILDPWLDVKEDYYCGLKISNHIDNILNILPERQDAIVIIRLSEKEQGAHFLLSFLDNYGELFKKIIIIPELWDISTLWVRVRDLDGILGLELHQKLLDPNRQLLKRLIDIFIVVVTSIITLPLLCIIVLLIKIDSKGPIFFKHRRIGYGGKTIFIYKFRTMVEDADTRLELYLSKKPSLREEWNANHKLKDDPRITRVGRLLRRTSLDELPQLWNVLKGELSVVGPRPIVESEISKYGSAFRLYKKVKPGITGLWQTSGRNKISYEERVALDVYYIRNWSVWLDIYILVKTPWAVLKGEGAY